MASRTSSSSAPSGWTIEIRRLGYRPTTVNTRVGTMDLRVQLPEKRVELIVDEWGTWFQVEPGTHPRFLYQQNSMRDALVAATRPGCGGASPRRIYPSRTTRGRWITGRGWCRGPAAG